MQGDKNSNNVSGHRLVGAGSSACKDRGSCFALCTEDLRKAQSGFPCFCCPYPVITSYTSQPPVPAPIDSSAQGGVCACK